MKGEYEYKLCPCRMCGSSARMHTVYGLFWAECDNRKCESNKHISPKAYDNYNDAFYAWNEENEK